MKEAEEFNAAVATLEELEKRRSLRRAKIAIAEDEGDEATLANLKANDDLNEWYLLYTAAEKKAEALAEAVGVKEADLKRFL